MKDCMRGFSSFSIFEEPISRGAKRVEGNRNDGKIKK